MVTLYFGHEGTSRNAPNLFQIPSEFTRECNTRMYGAAHSARTPS